MAVACGVVGVFPGFYDWLGRAVSARSVKNAQLLELVQWSHDRSRGTYSALRVHDDLTQERGVHCGKKEPQDS